MPIDLANQVSYSIDYDTLQNHLNTTFPLFFNNRITQQQYFSQWISLLKKCDLQDVSSFRNSANSFFPELQNKAEIYHHLVSLNGNTIILHFRITHLKKLLKDIPISMASPVSITEFSSTPPSIHWVRPNDFQNRPPLNMQPIIAVQYPTAYSNYLIVDGNHRIAMCISKGIPTIPTFFIDADQIVLQKVLGLSFESVFYLFQHDVNNLSSLKATHNLSDSALIDSSWFLFAQNQAI